ncbi:hypothetical protein GJV06_15095 [Enterobacteriaceae bacterium RIT691]|nr:hypothetical protein [Enterobacteriaceae bacterium RIT691]
MKAINAVLITLMLTASAAYGSNESNFIAAEQMERQNAINALLRIDNGPSAQEAAEFNDQMLDKMQGVILDTASKGAFSECDKLENSVLRSLNAPMKGVPDDINRDFSIALSRQVSDRCQSIVSHNIGR